MWNRLCRKRWWLRLSYLVGRKYIYPLSGISAAVSGRWGNSYIAEGRWNIYGVVLGPGKSLNTVPIPCISNGIGREF
jgi:hypothetical protein